MLLRDYERKRARAMLHYDALREAVKGSTDVDREPVPGDFQRDPGKYVFQMPLEPISRDWALVLGEFVYNTRASLDYLITALVRSTGKRENTGNQFPIYGVPKGIGFLDVHQWWDKANSVTRQLQNTPPGTRAALKQLQPFDGVPVTNPTDHPLLALAVMSNRDKHRRLNVLANLARYEFVGADGQPIFHGPFFPLQGRITETREGDTYTVTLLSEKLDMDVYLLATYDVGLHEPPELIGGLVETLAGINQFIDGRVVPTITALL